MNITDIKYNITSTSSLSYGSVMSEEDIMFLTDGIESVNFPFGKSDKDYLKVSVYNLDDSIVATSSIYAGGSYTNYTRSYYDVQNKYNIYSYKEFSSNWPVLTGETSSLFLDVAQVLRDMNVSDGNYKLVVQMQRNLVGSEKSSDQKMIIDTISTSRDEIALIPKSSKTLGGPLDVDYSIYSNNQVQIKDIAEDILKSISAPELYNIYYAAVNADPSGSAAFKFNYGFTNRNNQLSSDIDAISFLTDLYYGVRKGNLKNNGQIAVNDITGIYDQFKNWLYLNYENGATFEDIRNYYFSLFVFVVDQELNRINNTKPDNYDIIRGFLQRIYYNTIFFPTFYLVEYKYTVDLSGYFKNYINLNDGSSLPIINKKIIAPIDGRQYPKLALKLTEPLAPSVSVGDDIWITGDFGFMPLVQNIRYFTTPVINLIKLRGPNFNVEIENKGNSTEALSMDQLIPQTGSAYNGIIAGVVVPPGTIIDNTNYREFSNFVNLSSATLRIKTFDEKVSQLSSLESAVDEFNLKLQSNPDDRFYRKELDDANNEITRIKNSFDGYEKFLYDNPSWRDEHSASSSLYDRDNGGSLINNLPQFLVEDSEVNNDYITFVGMVGHFFDNLSLSVKQITEKNNYSISPSYGISLDIVEDMLSSLGWDAEISKETLPLILSSFSKKEFPIDSELYEQSRQLSEEQRNQIIWKRILNSIPHIYKTKGTEASLNALMSCFGIPKNIIKLKEYGGIQNVHSLKDESLYIIDDVKYEPYFSGSGEYFKMDWTGSAKTVEFNFAFDKNKTSEEGEVFRLVSCAESWTVGVYREAGKVWGKMFFSLSDGSGSIKTMMTNKAPIFDGNTYHAMIRRNYVAPEFGVYGYNPSQVNEYPTRYDLVLQKADNSHVSFFATSSVHVSGSYNNMFRSGSYLYVGNHNQNTASLNIDPEAFFGNIDEIKVWETPLGDESFLDHTLYQNAYDADTPNGMVHDNLIRISFERPLDLWNYGNPLTLNNLAFRGSFPTFQAINFPESKTAVQKVNECDYGEVSIFPWQFSRKDTRQTIKVPDYGSNKFRSNKINYVEQELISRLSPTERSSRKSSETVSADANKLGIFFSPTEIQNTEIMKFFGNYPLYELIGDPSDIYKSTYNRFEQFRQVFYDQGFGNINYQFFMNVVRYYFDKAMFKYIKSIVPARAKLVDGILIEPTILERPKLQIKPLVKQVIDQNQGLVDGKTNVVFNQFPRLTQSLDVKTSGQSILNDVNQVRFPVEDDPYGFCVYSDNGITVYNDEYYRADVVSNSKQFQVYNEVNLPKSSLDDYEKNININGTVTTVSRSYYKVNLAKLPFLHECNVTASFISVNFVGSVYLDSSLTSSITGNSYLQVSSSHVLDGKITGSIFGEDGYGTIFSPGINISASYGSYYTITYSGSFSQISAGKYAFTGSISGEFPAAAVNNPLVVKFYTTFYNSSTSTNSIFDEFKLYTQGSFFGPLASGLNYQKQYSMQYYPSNATLLQGYYINHYKYTKQQFSIKEITSYDQNNRGYKWKKHSQTKKTTVDPNTGLLNNTDPVETKTV